MKKGLPLFLLAFIVLAMVVPSVFYVLLLFKGQLLLEYKEYVNIIPIVMVILGLAIMVKPIKDLIASVKKYIYIKKIDFKNVTYKKVNKNDIKSFKTKGTFIERENRLYKALDTIVNLDIDLSGVKYCNKYFSTKEKYKLLEEETKDVNNIELDIINIDYKNKEYSYGLRVNNKVNIPIDSDLIDFCSTKDLLLQSLSSGLLIMGVVFFMIAGLDIEKDKNIYQLIFTIWTMFVSFYGAVVLVLNRGSCDDQYKNLNKE